MNHGEIGTGAERLKREAWPSASQAGRTWIMSGAGAGLHRDESDLRNTVNDKQLAAAPRLSLRYLHNVRNKLSPGAHGVSAVAHLFL